MNKDIPESWVYMLGPAYTHWRDTMLAGLIAAAVAALLNHAHEVGGPDAIQEAADAIRKAVDDHPLVDVE